MWKFTLPAVLTALLILIACSGTTSTPERTPVAAPTAGQGQSPAPARTATPVKETAPEPTGSPRTAPTMTPRPTRAEAATPAIPKAPEATDDSAGSIITLLTMKDSDILASELSDSETACLAGTADAEKLSQIFLEPFPLTPEKRNLILGCLEQETLIQIYLGGTFGDSEPLSSETGACLRTVLNGIDFRSWMLLLRTQNEWDEIASVMLVSSFFVTIACLNQEEWEAIAVTKDLHPSDRKNSQCFLVMMGGPEGLTTALEAGDERGLPDLQGAARDCGSPFEDPWNDPQEDHQEGPKAGPASTLSLS